MLMALSFVSVLLRAGQMSTHNDGRAILAATFSVNFQPLNSGLRLFVLLKAAGAPSSAAG